MKLLLRETVDQLGTIGDIVALVEAAEAEQPRERGPYKKASA